MNRRGILLSLITALFLNAKGTVGAPLPSAKPPVITRSTHASAREVFAAREVRRYLYLRTGRLASVQVHGTARLPADTVILITTKTDPTVHQIVTEPALRDSIARLEPQQFLLKTIKIDSHKVLLLVGGDSLGSLYAAYRLAEHFDVRFYLHGDVVPDEQVPLDLPTLDERSMPIFDLRGIQPFHDFPEGPDWWNLDDYAMVIGQLPKLRMNFFGLHTYPENAPNAEPTVWIGTKEDIGIKGEVGFAYPASYQNTMRGNWGYEGKPTSRFAFGAAQLFDQDTYGAEVMQGAWPQPTNAPDCNAVFNGTGSLLRNAFSIAREFGVATCVGTETPLVVPKLVAERLRAAGKNPADRSVIEEIYQGIFTRIMRTYPLDYYWFWTPEGWTWEGTKDEQVKATLSDLEAAISAAQSVGATFKLATCGWVLGPQQDRALFDKTLPRDVAVSCINRQVGNTPVDRGFLQVRGRGKWAIPWMEDDPGLSVPQLWVGRMRRDAADARRYGCDGLMGIHWRTRVLGPAVAALAQAAWDQSRWNPDPFTPAPEPVLVAGSNGGQCASFQGNAIADTDNPQLYQTVRYNLTGYHLPMPNGPCRVTLMFCEPHYAAAGQRVFSVAIQGRKVIDQLDIFAKVGQNRALDYVFNDLAITNGWLDIAFLPVVEFPSVAGIVAESGGRTTKINCGGPAYKDFAADLVSSPSPENTFPSTTDFYADWATHEFGVRTGLAAAAIFARIDGHLPRPADWVDGPGGIRPDNRPWSTVSKDYGFVAEFESLAPNVTGAGSRARFNYWCDTFRYMRAMARVNCVWSLVKAAMDKAKAEPNAPTRARAAAETVLPLRRELIQDVAEVYQHLLALVSNAGELGTVANWEQHLLPNLLTRPGVELAQLLGSSLPADCETTTA